ncbi:MAG: dihydroxy-acid dehydratase [Acidobacteriota bacterium]
MRDESSLKEELIEKDEEFRSLHEEHLAHKAKLQEIREKSLLSEEDEVEIKRIKLKKLELKDRMEVILNRHRAEVSTTA